MDDQQLWNFGMARLKGLLAEIPTGTAQKLAQVLTSYRKAKENFAAIIAEVDAASICLECAGQCCQNGKYRINVLDVVARLAVDIRTTADFTRKPVCPYSTETGCSMEPGLRPADCVLFICNLIELALSPQAREFLDVQEQVVRECIQNASDLIGEKMGTPLLLWAGKITVE